MRLRQHRRTEVMFPDDPSTLPLASPPRSSLPLPSQPPSPACSPLAPLFLLLAASFSRFTLLLCPSPSLSLSPSCVLCSPFLSLFLLRVTFFHVVRRRSEARRVAPKFREIRAARPRIESHTWRRFSSALRPLRAPTLGYADAPLSFSFFLRAVPSFSSTCGGLSLLHARTDVPYALYLTRVYVRASACTSPRVFRAAYPPSRQPVS